MNLFDRFIGSFTVLNIKIFILKLSNNKHEWRTKKFGLLYESQMKSDYPKKVEDDEECEVRQVEETLEKLNLFSYHHNQQKTAKMGPTSSRPSSTTRKNFTGIWESERRKETLASQNNSLKCKNIQKSDEKVQDLFEMNPEHVNSLYLVGQFLRLQGNYLDREYLIQQVIQIYEMAAIFRVCQTAVFIKIRFRRFNMVANSFIQLCMFDKKS